MTIVERPRAVTKTPLNERTIGRALAVELYEDYVKDAAA